ncbi:NAD(P)/FAD-dependent oxidoreductase [Halopelagius fulvigenes]|uniref:NAD(P)/FAD-dependent oxidoreductase n=1 Tax=Halopelagius fulvigenes TaxID=1198324 RepID=A0ABD5TVK3_9EURY
MSPADTAAEGAPFEYDVIVVGGGPAGCSAGVFTARYGLKTAVFDRGNSSLRRCAYLENYPGFPAGIDVETLYGLLHDHAEEAGCEVISDLVESVERADGTDGFVVETQEGRRVTARRVVAATRYDGEYMRGLDDDEEMFVAHEHDGEVHEHFDRDYPERDGTTRVDGLYVASPAPEADRQAIMAAGRGARVGLTLVDEVRRSEGYLDTLADQYDWMRREAELTGEWGTRDRWREWFDGRLPEEHSLPAERVAELREREIDRKFDTYLSDDDIERRTRRGHERLLERIDDELVLRRAREIESERRSAESDD